MLSFSGSCNFLTISYLSMGLKKEKTDITSFSHGLRWLSVHFELRMQRPWADSSSFQALWEGTHWDIAPISFSSGESVLLSQWSCLLEAQNNSAYSYYQGKSEVRELKYLILCSNRITLMKSRMTINAWSMIHFRQSSKQQLEFNIKV